MEEVKMSFKPLAEALVEFRAALLDGGFNTHEAHDLATVLLDAVAKNPAFSNPPVVRLRRRCDCSSDPGALCFCPEGE
jgi:hypothetical protein